MFKRCQGCKKFMFLLRNTYFRNPNRCDNCEMDMREAEFDEYLQSLGAEFEFARYAEKYGEGNC